MFPGMRNYFFTDTLQLPQDKERCLFQLAVSENQKKIND
jgi:hypothetical protein